MSRKTAADIKAAAAQWKRSCGVIAVPAFKPEPRSGRVAVTVAVLVGIALLALGILVGCAGDKATGLKTGGAAASAAGAALTAIPFPPAMIAGTVLSLVGTLMTAAGAAMEKPKILKAGAAIGIAGLTSAGAGVAMLPPQAAIVAPAEPGAAPAAPTGTAVPQ